MLSNYSEDEAFMFVLGIVTVLATWAWWYYQLAAIRSPVRPQALRWPLSLAPVGSAVLLWAVLKLWSAEDVRENPDYVWFYMVIGAAWAGLFRLMLPGRLGLSARDDALERGNRGTSWAVAGALIGVTCCFAGANVGNGPGWWVVLFSAGLATASLVLAWWVLHLAADLPEKISVERDEPAGVRAAGLLVGTGIILGRAAAGDWVSAVATTIDFGKIAWPALILIAAAVLVERTNPPDALAGRPTILCRGIIPALLYIATGALWLLLLRKP